MIATVARTRVRAENLRHRAVFVLVRSSHGEVLVHRRSDTKDLWPSLWDLAVGGVVTAGEGYDEAAVREIAEELGINGVVLERLGSGRFEDDDVRLLGVVYRVEHDGPFTFADGEVVEADLRRAGRPRGAAAAGPVRARQRGAGAAVAGPGRGLALSAGGTGERRQR